MVHNRVKTYQKNAFFKGYEEVNPSLVLGLIIVTVGLYVIGWIYARNKDMMVLDENAPDNNRGLAVMVGMPAIWFFITFGLRSFFTEFPLILRVVEILGWLLIVFLIYKYLFDFTHSFVKLTLSNIFVWFGCFVVGGIGFIGLIFGFYYIVPLAFFAVIVIPAMQAELNVTFRSHTIRKHDTR